MKGRCQQLTDTHIYTTVRMGIANSFCTTRRSRWPLIAIRSELGGAAGEIVPHPAFGFFLAGVIEAEAAIAAIC